MLIFYPPTQGFLTSVLEEVSPLLKRSRRFTFMSSSNSISSYRMLPLSAAKANTLAITLTFSPGNLSFKTSSNFPFNSFHLLQGKRLLIIFLINRSVKEKRNARSVMPALSCVMKIDKSSSIISFNIFNIMRQIHR